MSEMNPRVAQAAALVPFDAADYTGVDIMDLEATTEELKPHAYELEMVFEIKTMPLLFERMAVLPPKEHWDTTSVATIERINGEVHFKMWLKGYDKVGYEAVLSDNTANVHGLDVHLRVDPIHHKNLMKHLNNSAEEAQRWLLGSVTHLMAYLYYGTVVKRSLVESFTCTAHGNNAKRRRQKKVPMYEWKTIYIDDVARKRLEHAVRAAKPRAPQREHDVRGHWAISKLGKKFWRKAHKRGDASLGTIFHDYQMQGD